MGHFRLSNIFLLILAVAAYVAVASALLIPTVVAASHIGAWLGVGHALSFHAAWWPVAWVVLLSLASVFVTVPLIVLWLRYLERRDSS